jgi:hypothetical protein
LAIPIIPEVEAEEEEPTTIEAPETQEVESTIEEPTEQEDSFVESTTIRDANQFIENRFGIKADYKGINIEVANEMNRSFYDTFEAFPELKQNFDFVGGAHTHVKLIKEKIINEAIEDLKRAGINGEMFDNSVERIKRSFNGLFKVSKDTWAQSLSKEVKGISFNEVNTKNMAETKAILKKDVESKFHPVGCDTIKSVIDHELGHQLDNLLGLDKLDEIQELFDSLSPSELTGKLSRYSWYNSSASKYAEFIAEAWAEYKNNPRPREIARKVGKIIEREYRRKFGGAKG